MTGVFKANNPYNTFLLMGYAILLKLHFILHPAVPVIQTNDGFLFKIIVQQIQGWGSHFTFLFPLIAFFLIFMQAMLFNEISREQKLFQKPNYLIGMTFMLITSLFSEWNTLSAPLIAGSFLIWIWAKMSAISQEKKPLTTLFNIGLVLGIATFFYLPSILFVALIILGLLFTRPFRPSEWLLSIIGLLTPYYFFSSYLFITDHWTNFHFAKMIIASPVVLLNKTEIVSLWILLIGSLWGLGMMRKNFFRQLVQTRKSWNLIQLYLSLALLFPFLSYNNDLSNWIIAALPLSSLISCAFFYPERRIFPMIYHWILFLLAIFSEYFVK